MRVLDAPSVEIGLWALAIGMVVSTQFLSQVFIWRDYPLVDIMTGWRAIARDRLIVSGIIGAALMLVGRVRTRSLASRLALLGGAVVAGAVSGELVLQLLTAGDDRQDVVSLVGRMVRWSFVGGSVAAMIYLWRSGSELALAGEQTRIEEASLRKLAASTHIEVLKRQIEPHFLFNTLATVRRLQATSPERGDQLLGRLLDYMSASIGAPTDGSWTLGREVALVLAYVDIFVIRMDGRLKITADLPADLDAVPFPSLILATLAENAIKHGIFPQDGGTIAITAARQSGTVIVTLADDGVGFSSKQGGTGIGLNNIAERLRLLHGEGARLHLGLNEMRGVRATITLPIVTVPASLP